ncbi:sensor histidine kinase [Bailinhaonella thermotolerans]|uniref:sensor histidine kinase n=1 Tax=Bailinhaonella thermotolerans TaxID=1070861 RepID=UPI001F5B3DF3|nr:histidine kinase [Bailinhaonella thermotolerans]
MRGRNWRNWRNDGFDVLCAAAGVLAALTSYGCSACRGNPALESAELVADVLVGLSLGLMRRRPVAVFGFQFAVAVVMASGAAGPASGNVPFTLLAALGGVGFRGGAVLITVAYTLAVVLDVANRLLWARFGVAGVPLEATAILLTAAAPVAFGRYLGALKEGLRAAESRARHAEARRVAETRAARLAERARIARDLHDSVAHHVGAIVLRAGAAGYARAAARAAAVPPATGPAEDHVGRHPGTAAFPAAFGHAGASATGPRDVRSTGRSGRSGHSGHSGHGGHSGHSGDCGDRGDSGERGRAGAGTGPALAAEAESGTGDGAGAGTGSTASPVPEPGRPGADGAGSGRTLGEPGAAGPRAPAEAGATGPAIPWPVVPGPRTAGTGSGRGTGRDSGTVGSGPGLAGDAGREVPPAPGPGPGAAGPTGAGGPGGAAAGVGEDDVLGEIREMGVRALGDLRRLLAVLRDPEAAEDPLPVADPEGLVAEAVKALSAAGLDVDLEVDPEVAAVPVEVRAEAARVVREGLTNALKHAGPGTAVEVRVFVAEGELCAEVRNGAPARPPEPFPASGYGLAGARERVERLAGHVSAGPTPDGGWLLAVRLPERGAA